MRIISDFRDYYDKAMGLGQDPSLIYHRKRRVIWSHKREIKYDLLPVVGWGTRNHLRVVSHLIGFCGEFHRALYLEWVATQDRPGSSWCYNIDSVDRFITPYLGGRDLVYYEAKDRKDYKHLWREDFRVKFRVPEGGWGKAVSWFEEYGCALFAYLRGDRDELVVNPRLSDFEFFRVVDPYQAYQKLSMYWGSRTHPDKPIPEVSDEDLAAAKGFDRFSFRKPKREGK